MIGPLWSTDRDSVMRYVSRSAVVLVLGPSSVVIWLQRGSD